MEPWDLSRSLLFRSDVNCAMRSLHGHFCDRDDSRKIFREGVKSNAKFRNLKFDFRRTMTIKFL